jgi:hypothetical protein
VSDVISNINENYIGGEILDGQWINMARQELFNGTLPAYNKTGSVVKMELGDILPNDNYIYLCQLEVITATDSTSGHQNIPCFKSGELERTYVLNSSSTTEAAQRSGLCLTEAGRIRTRTASTRGGGSWLYIPVYPDDRNISVVNCSYSGTLGVRLFAMRKLGTNT